MHFPIYKKLLLYYANLYIGGNANENVSDGILNFSTWF